jgi:GNAT superfamily N-acetyltransferase
MSTRFRIVRAGMEHVGMAAPLFDAYRQFYKLPPDPEKGRKFLSERLSRSESVVFLALIEGETGWIAAAFMQLYPTFSSLSLKRLWILNDLFVAPQARKAGIAKALMERARQLAAETGAEGLILETAVDNVAAQTLYERLGWKRDEKFYRYALMF